MEFKELKTDEFLRLLASDAPSPGGGAAAALAGSMGAALVEMVASLTKGKEKYSQFENIVIDIIAEAEALRSRLNAAVDGDAEAYAAVSAAYKMPKQSQEQIDERAAAIEDALKKATLLPVELMELVYACALLCEKALGKTNINLESDLEVSAVLLCASAQGAYIMARTNLSLLKDGAFVAEYEGKSNRLLGEIEALTANIAKSLRACR